MCNTSEDLVREFRKANETADVETSLRCLEQLRRACQPIVHAVSSRYSNLGSFVDEVSEEVLHDCLMKFQLDPTHSFRSYFRTALSNRATDECRQRRRYTSLDSDPLDLPDRNLDDTVRLTESLELYVRRKRQLVDVAAEILQLEYPYATLLIDQRYRMAAIGKREGHLPLENNLSTWVDATEQWHIEDHAKSLSATGPQTGVVWRKLTVDIDSESDELTYRHITDAFRRSGASLNLPTWRKRVSRYLNILRDKLDEEEIRYFDH